MRVYVCANARCGLFEVRMRRKRKVKERGRELSFTSLPNIKLHGRLGWLLSVKLCTYVANNKEKEADTNEMDEKEEEAHHPKSQVLFKCV